MSTIKFNSECIKTDVTSIKIHQNFILCGIGGFLHIFNLSTLNLIHKLQVFKGFRIYGIHINSTSTKLFFHAENELKIFDCCLQTLRFTETASHPCHDWILAASWLNNDENIVTISMHNIAEYWSCEMKKIKETVCEERCISYCASTSYQTWDTLVVFSGTVFSEILIWMPSKGKNLEFCPVLKRLIGHKGVIFSVNHNVLSKYICSTSDDRAVILWKINGDLHQELSKHSDDVDIELSQTMYGHTARVFNCKVLTNFTISIGEDGTVNIWNLDGNLFKKINAHQSGPIWALDCDEEKNLIVTGGGDSGVTKFSLTLELAKEKICLSEKQVPKKCVVLSNNDLVIITESGGIFRYKTKSKELTLIKQNDELKSYSLLEVSNCRKLVALAGYNGHLFIYKLESEELTLLSSYQTKMKERIFSLHWLSCSLFLTCGLKGLLYLWIIHNGNIILLHIMELPEYKERWSTAACICGKRLIAVGDRKGNVILYDVDTFKPRQIIKKAHNYLGITNVYFEQNTLITLGRNSILKKFHLNKDLMLTPTSSDKLPFTWLASIINKKQTTIISAFSGTDFVLWDYKTRCTLLEINCGGGHRSWDFNNDTFVYIKDKAMHLLTYNWDSLYPINITQSLHINEINCLKKITNLNSKKTLVITGGEDTTLRVSTYENSVFNNLSILKSHLSSIRCLSLIKTANDKVLLFSAGGRAQIIVWEIVEGVCNELFSFYEALGDDEAEIRVMDMCIVEEGGIFVFTSCSDGRINVYHKLENSLKLVGVLQYKLKCILKVATIKFIDYIVIVSMATDGLLVFWKIPVQFFTFKTEINNFQPFHKIKAHQSGINSFCFKQISNSTYSLLTGGDDNALTLNIIKFSKDLSLETLASYTNISTHVAQISGVYLSENYIFSASLDQKLVIMEYVFDQDVLDVKYVACYDTTISDIKGIEVTELQEETHKSFDLILYGLGVEFLHVNI